MNIEQDQQGGESQEFTTIRQLASGVDAEAHTAVHGEAPAAPEAVPVDPAAAWAEIPTMFGGMLCMAMPELSAVYTPAACYQWGAAMSKVAEKRGWQIDGMPPEITAVVITGMLVLPTVGSIKARAEASRRQRAAEEKARESQQFTGGGDGSNATTA